MERSSELRTESSNYAINSIGSRFNKGISLNVQIKIIMSRIKLLTNLTQQVEHKNAYYIVINDTCYK